MHLLSPFSLNLPLYEHKKRPSYDGLQSQPRSCQYQFTYKMFGKILFMSSCKIWHQLRAITMLQIREKS